MKIALLDTFSGLSGDMMIGALISAGLPFDYLKSELEKLNLHGYELEITAVQRKSITATKFNVRLLNQYLNQTGKIHNTHHHKENHDHHHHHNSRTYSEIIELINNSSLNQNIKDISKKIFTIIGEAEAKNSRCKTGRCSLSRNRGN